MPAGNGKDPGQKLKFSPGEGIMAMTKCAECARDISTLAAACPGCGAPVGLPQAAPLAKPQLRLPFKIAIGAVGLLIIVAAASGGSTSPPASPEPATDYSAALYTKFGAIVCPYAVVFDKRQGGGLAAANDALVTSIGREEAAQKAGCQQWRSGIQLFVQPAAVPKEDGHVHWMEAHQSPDFGDLPVLIATGSLSNKPGSDK